MSVELADRLAVVTGACSDIGRGIAFALAEKGASLLLADLDEAKLAGLADEFFGIGLTVATCAGDLSKQDDVAGLMAQAEALGGVDILVNNAGGGIIKPFLDHTPETLAATVDRNLWTALWCCWYAIPQMRDKQFGRIINIGADSVRNGLAAHAAYNAAKGGVHGMTTGLAREFAPDNITVNTVAPCAVQTAILNEFLEKDPETAAKFLQVIPVGRAAKVSEVASMVTYLAGEDAAFVTGQVISVNGGSTML
ncbi:SDR family oxidoreductase [Spongiibacter taiwanensis]|uniref:SDR family NAD(P)-dependent oxidoreductase n=1 Tax=Spongiibacter taiwanensis TaxID=1748242 RepID=UPI002034FECE|nr:SDR family oxidoreductase [Spongiibacter taiwanensis]USA42694.1 SDR family oxidoreductase [Spongiibacter taiwanensis]